MVQSTHTIAGMMDIDLQAYEEPALVALYSRSVDLQPPEATLFERLRSKLGSMDVLDLGVGAGRTSLHFAPVAKSYLGVDYSEAMIAACSRRMPGVRFLVGDARSMDFAAASSFDLVLFSYNGIDHLTGAERAQFLLEARRILRPGGFLIFSSHNANFFPSIVANNRFRIGGSLRDTLRSLKWAMIFQLRNRGLSLRSALQEGRVVDGTHGFKSAGLYYIRPDLQIDALRALGMEEIACAPNTASEFLPPDDAGIRHFTSPWVYYVCRKPRG